MRVALYLLLLLGIAAIPGSVFPQRSASPAKVQQYFTEHPDLALWLDRLRMFDVYGSPWFSAIYLLLLISLTGCVLPRTRQHFQELRQPPKPPTAALWNAEGIAVTADQSEILKAFRRSRRSIGENWIAVDAGFHRETANILFHASMLGILLAVASGSLFGYHGQVILREGTSFTNSIAQYDSFAGGRLFQPSWLQPFNISLSNLEVTYQTQGRQAGDAIDYAAHVSVDKTDAQVIGVNSPLTIGQAGVFLVGHGYAPQFEVRDNAGNLVFSDSVVFLPRDKNFTSDGVVKVPDMKPQLGLDAIFAPTGVVTESAGPHSLFPDLVDPKVFMSAWVGDLGLDNGIAQNIYTLDKSQLKRIGFEELQPGETWKLPKDAGTVKFVGVVEFATFNINSDPGQSLALCFAFLAIISLTLMVRTRRYRLWFLRSESGWRLVAPELQDEAEIASLTQRLKGD